MLAFEIAIVACLILLNGCFALSELAIVSARPARLTARAAAGSRGAQLALKLAERPGRFLSSVQIGITLIGILAGAYSGATLAEPLARWFAARLPELAEAADALAIALVVGAITYGSLIVGELVPKQIALANPERVAVLVAPPMVWVARIAAPLVWLLESSSRLLLAAIGVRRGQAQAVTEEEVKAMIAEGTASGVFEPQEKEMLSGVLRFGDRTVRGVMTPRNEMVWIDLDWPQERILDTLLGTPHSRIPVCRGGLDEVVGVVRAKDLLDAALQRRPFEPAAAVQTPAMVHDYAPALHVLEVLKRGPIHMALVVDEHGSVEGIVTAADILVALLGGLAEHGEEYGGAIVQREDGSWLVDGDTSVDIAAERLGCPAMADRRAGYTTVAGFLLSRFRSIPDVGHHVTVDGWRFEVVDMDGRRIDKVLVSRQPSV